MADVKKLYRLAAQRKIAGVCAGLGDYFELDPLLFRLVFLASLFFGGLGAVAYAAMWIMVPAREGVPLLYTGRRARLSAVDRKLLGVSGGLGEFFGLDAVFFRIGFVVLAFACATGILLYLALWLLMPAADSVPAGRPAA